MGATVPGARDGDGMFKHHAIAARYLWQALQRSAGGVTLVDAVACSRSGVFKCTFGALNLKKIATLTFFAEQTVVKRVQN
jgi:uncharacterized caspase-like protein